MKSIRHNIVISTYHLYQELWEYIIDNIKSNIPNSRIFLITDKGSIKSELANLIVTGEQDWTKNIKSGLKIIKSDYGVDTALFTFDDLLINKIKLAKINEVKYYLESNLSIDCIKIAHPHLNDTKYDSNYCIVNKKRYQTTLVFSYWKIDSLSNLFIDNYNPWEFDEYGYLKHHKTILSTNEKCITYTNLIIKGKVIRNSPLKINSFKMMTRMEQFKYSTRLSVKLIRNYFIRKMLAFKS